MKKRYFKFVTIDSTVVLVFLNKHPELKVFINPNIPFDVRVSLKPYPALIQHILCQDVSSEIANISANKLVQLVDGKIVPKKINKLGDDQLNNITSKEKAFLIRQITQDIISKKLNLKKLSKLSSEEIIKALSSYQGLTLNTIKQFCLFSCFKQDVLCVEDPDFIDGLKIYLNKKDISKQDIINIEQQFSGQYTLFSLCM